MNDFKIIRNDLISLGLGKGDSVLIHSSFKSMGEVDGGIQTLVDAILDCIGSTGTLLAPTLSYEYVPQTNPIYNHVDTPSCVGAVSEFIRSMDGAKRSIHPTHSCAAIGDKRDFFVCGHENDETPVGENSPISKLPKIGGKVLMLGCFFGFNTSMHGIEEKFPVSYVLSEKPISHTIVLNDRTYEKNYYRHSISKNGFDQRYDRLLNVMDVNRGIIHGAQSILIDCATMWKTALETLKKDEFYFVERRVTQ
ncbi:MAG: AAC(3) family N-acetyltransferase [Clostridia bacterium]|nr:AAC(3) family N-acetyltransferase [Clostridia bacterium]